MNNGIEQYKTVLQTISALMKSTLSREISQTFLESIIDLEIDENIDYIDLVKIIGKPNEFHDAYYEGSLENVNSNKRAGLARFIARVRLGDITILGRPQYNKQYQKVLFIILLIPVFLNFIVINSSILPNVFLTKINNSEINVFFNIIVLYFVKKSSNGLVNKYFFFSRLAKVSKKCTSPILFFPGSV